MSSMLHHEHRFAEAHAASVDPINGMLDLFEAQVRLLTEHGAEGPMRARLARLLPEPERAAQVATETPAPVISGDDALLAASGASVLRQIAKLRRAGPARSQIEVIAGLLSRIARAPKTIATETLP